MLHWFDFFLCVCVFDSDITTTADVMVVDCRWNAMAHGDAWEGKWMEWSG